VGDTGLEPIGVTALPHNDLRDSQKQSGAKSGALGSLAELAAAVDPALGAVVEAWPDLHPSARLAITAVVDASLQSVMSTS